MKPRLTRKRLLALSIALVAVVWTSLPDSGAIRDKATGKPIAGAIVMAEWNGSIMMPVQSSSTCYKVAMAISDADGRFSMPSLSWDLRPYLFGRSRSIRVLAMGRREAPDSDASNLRIVMEPDDRPPREQVDRITDPLRSLGCSGGNEAIFRPLLLAVRQELARLPASAEIERKSDWLTYEIDLLDVGEAEAYRRQEHRREAETSRRMVHVACSAPDDSDAISCCLGFGDPRGFSALEAKIRAADIAFVKREGERRICVRRRDRDAAVRMANEVVANYESAGPLWRQAEDLPAGQGSSGRGWKAVRGNP